MTVTVDKWIEDLKDGDGVTLTFNHSLRVDQGDSEIRCAIYDAAGVRRIPTFTTAGGPVGGSVTITAPSAAPAVGEQILIWRETDLTQPVNYEAGKFPSKTHERASDRLFMAMQEARGNSRRTLRFDPLSPEIAPLPPIPEGSVMMRTATGFGPGPLASEVENAEANAQAATAAATNAGNSAGAAVASATAAATSETNAGNSASAAAASATAAATSETNAGNSASAAAASATAAATSETNAGNSAGAAAASATAAATSETNAGNSAGAAAGSATAAADSATDAAASAATAATFDPARFLPVEFGSFENLILNGDFSVVRKGAASKDVGPGVRTYEIWKGHVNGLEQIVEALPAGDYTLVFDDPGVGYIGATSGPSPLKATIAAGNTSVVVPKDATKVMLLAGDHTGAASLAFKARPRQIEELLLSRYYLPDQHVAGSGYSNASGNTTRCMIHANFPVTMRATPAFSYVCTTNNNVKTNPTTGVFVLNEHGLTMSPETNAGPGQATWKGTFTADARL